METYLYFVERRKNILEIIFCLYTILNYASRVFDTLRVTRQSVITEL